MVFIVEANSGRPGEGSFRAEKTTRKDAVKTAVGLIGQGMEGVTITDENGRVYPTLNLPPSTVKAIRHRSQMARPGRVALGTSAWVSRPELPARVRCESPIKFWSCRNIRTASRLTQVQKVEAQMSKLPCVTGCLVAISLAVSVVGANAAETGTKTMPDSSVYAPQTRTLVFGTYPSRLLPADRCYL
jgi:hypothetical protein